MANTQAAQRSSGRSWTSELPAGLIGLCSLSLAGTILAGRGVVPVAAALIFLSVLVAWHKWILDWRVLLCIVLAVVLFVPVSRYSLSVPLPFGFELYRIAVGVVLLIWIASLLVDPKVRLQRSPLDAPVMLILVATLGSMVVNYGRVAPLASVVLKSLTLFVSFVVFFYFISSIIKNLAAVIVVAQFVVAGVAVVAIFAIVEQRTGFSPFNHLHSLLPFLEYHEKPLNTRYGLLRAYGSADHPIALGVLFAMTAPLGIALARSISLVWWLPTSLIAIGMLASASRTPITAIVVAAIVVMWIRPREVLPLLPLAIPMLIVIKIAAPGSIATVKDAFFPQSGFIAEQSTLAADPTLISGRANLGARIVEGMHTPILGQGFGTRQTGDDNPLRNAPILDNQWLGVFLDVGLVGLVGWCWLIARSVRRLGYIARTRGSPEGIIALGLVGSIVGFATAMFTYDSFAFIQETVLFWVILALASSLIVALSRDEPFSAGLEP